MSDLLLVSGTLIASVVLGILFAILNAKLEGRLDAPR